MGENKVSKVADSDSSDGDRKGKQEGAAGSSILSRSKDIKKDKKKKNKKDKKSKKGGKPIFWFIWKSSFVLD